MGGGMNQRYYYSPFFEQTSETSRVTGWETKVISTLYAILASEILGYDVQMVLKDSTGGNLFRVAGCPEPRPWNWKELVQETFDMRFKKW